MAMSLQFIADLQRAAANAGSAPAAPTPQGGNISPQFLTDIQSFASSQQAPQVPQGGNLSLDFVTDLQRAVGVTPPAPFVPQGGNISLPFVTDLQAAVGVTPPPAPPPGPAIPPTGLAGSELALNTGLTSALDSLTQAGATGRADITAGTTGALDLLTGAGQTVAGQFQQGQDILAGAGQDINARLLAGQNILTGAGQNVATQFGQGQNLLTAAGVDVSGLFGQGQGLLRGAGQDVSNLFQQGIDPVSQFIQPGADALQLQLALSGALGQEAFNAALIQSPAQQFLLDEGIQARLRGASATGGLAGGDILKELTRFGQGQASTRLQEQIDNLSTLSAQGLTGATVAGQLRGLEAGVTSDIGRAGATLAGLEAGVTSEIGRAGATLAGQEAGITSTLGVAGAGLTETGATLAGDLGRTGADLTGREAAITSILGQTGADISQLEGLSLANLEQTLGPEAARAFLETGQLTAAGRTVAGQDIAGAIGEATTALSTLVNQQGIGVSDILASAGTNLANILRDLGVTDATSREQLATILANIATGSASTTAGLPGIPGTQETSGILDDVVKVIEGAGTAAAA